MIRIQQLKLGLKHKEEDIKSAAAKMLHLDAEQLSEVKIVKKSIDARKKEDIKYIYAIDVFLKEEENHRMKLKRLMEKNSSVFIPNDTVYSFWKTPSGLPPEGRIRIKNRPVVIGSGPAGLFCGLFLAMHGYCPLILERGECVEKRQKSVQRFWDTAILEEKTNVQFGEGGAGTFSDGKLNTLVKDITGRNKRVLEVFCDAGAPEEILYLNKAHIGTDVLCTVVKNIREQIKAYGGEVRFESQVTDFFFENAGNEKRICAVEVNGEEEISCDAVVLAIGHSARDTFQTLYQKKVEMLPKAFAVGVRIEHPQKLINKAQYGMETSPYLPPADYKVAYQTSNGRSSYSFCMCPGGYVVNASSEKGGLAVNGMSYHSRSGRNANSALIVSVTPEDFESMHPLSGVEYQRKLERAAFQAAGGRVPVQLYEDFCKNRASSIFKEVLPSIKGEYAFANLREILPEYVSASLIEGIGAFGRKMKDFDRGDAILSGVESRTSSPVRIVRDERLESNIKGLYPCGEGAGYAGGITSAAMDGIKIAEAIAKKYAE